MALSDSFCCNNLTEEFMKVEKRLKRIAIPAFSILTTIFVVDNQNSIGNLVLDFLLHLVIVTGFIIIFWWALRLIFFRVRKTYPDEKHYFRRLIILSLTSILLSIAIYVSDNLLLIIIHVKNTTFLDCLIEYRLMLLATITFSLLVNAIYESFHLFHRLSEKVVEVEEYRKSIVESQYQNLTNKINPHFLFNSLNTLAGVIEESPGKAVVFVQELSDVYRYVLNSEKNTWVDLASEMEFAKSFISLLKMRFEDNLQVEINIPKGSLNKQILPLTMQMLIENAVKHNEISNQNKLKVQVFADDGHLVVENNINLKKMNTDTTKIGLKNIRERYHFLTGKEISVEHSEAKFKIVIPLVQSAQ